MKVYGQGSVHDIIDHSAEVSTITLSTVKVNLYPGKDFLTILIFLKIKITDSLTSQEKNRQKIESHHVY